MMKYLYKICRLKGNLYIVEDAISEKVIVVANNLTVTKELELIEKFKSKRLDETASGNKWMNLDTLHETICPYCIIHKLLCEIE